MYLMICSVQEFPYPASNLELLNHTSVIKPSRLDSTTNTPSNKVLFSFFILFCVLSAGLFFFFWASVYSMLLVSTKNFRGPA